MNAVGHQDEDMDYYLIFVRRVFEKRQIGFEIHLITETGFPVIAALNNMLGTTRKTKAG